MSTKYRFSDSDTPHFTTLTLVEWVDLFTREKYKELILKNLKYCQQNKHLSIHAYVIMTNHLHLIVSTDKSLDLGEIIRDFKRYTARVIVETLKQDETESRKNWLMRVLKNNGLMSSSNEKYKVWQHENHPVMLDTNKMFKDRLNYTHENPVRAGICYTPEDYKYSSASNYAGKGGLLEVNFLD